MAGPAQANAKASGIRDAAAVGRLVIFSRQILTTWPDRPSGTRLCKRLCCGVVPCKGLVQCRDNISRRVSEPVCCWWCNSNCCRN